MCVCVRAFHHRVVYRLPQIKYCLCVCVVVVDADITTKRGALRVLANLRSSVASELLLLLLLPLRLLSLLLLRISSIQTRVQQRVRYRVHESESESERASERELSLQERNKCMCASANKLVMMTRSAQDQTLADCLPARAVQAS